MKLWDTVSGRLLATLQEDTGGILDGALSGNGSLVASGHSDGTVKLWDTATVRLRTSVAAHATSVRTVTLSADGHLLASGSFDATVKLWETGGGTHLRTQRAERRYEGLNITGLRGVTQAQGQSLIALSAIERG